MYPRVFLLTSSIAVKQEGVLELEVQVFGDWLCQVLHTESVHNGEAVPGRGQSEMKNSYKNEPTATGNKRHCSYGTPCCIYHDILQRNIFIKLNN